LLTDYYASDVALLRDLLKIDLPWPEFRDDPRDSDPEYSNHISQ
jgi:hypothetical protein